MKSTNPPDQSIQNARKYIDQIKDVMGTDVRSKIIFQKMIRGNTGESYSSDSARSNQEDDEDRPRTIHELAKMVKNKQYLHPVVVHFLIPRNLDQNLRPSEAYIH